jgi:D-alanine-D-alanine ligase
MKRIIGITYDLKSDWPARDDDPRDASAEFDSPATLEMLIRALQSGGYRIKKIGNVRNLLSQVERLDVDIVLNICEGYAGRNRESQVPIVLEMHGIPFIGADALTLGITLDKTVAKKCFIADGIPTPRFMRIEPGEQLAGVEPLQFPLIVKTCHEGTSKGITGKSRVENLEGLKEQTEMIHRVYRQPALVEEFIRGTEFTVAVLGNQNPEAMPVVQVSIDGRTDLGDDFYTYDRVCGQGVRYVCPATIPDELTKNIQKIAIQAYKSVGCRDFGRVDFRVDEKGNPYVLEINPLPNLGPEDVFNIFPQVMGLTYDEIINRIVAIGLQRYGINVKTSGEEQLLRR